MDLKLDKTSSIPIGIQLKEQIKMQVNSDKYNEGDKLPSISQMAASAGVNKNTIVSTLKDLETEGYINSRRGKGIFVNRKQCDKTLKRDFLSKVDLLIYEARKRSITFNELINIIGARFAEDIYIKDLKVLLVADLGKKILDNNLRELHGNFPQADIKGLLLCPELKKEEESSAYEWAELIIVPSYLELIQDIIPKNKKIIKAVPNLKLSAKTRKKIDKKSKLAIISVLYSSPQIEAELFTSQNQLRPKLAIHFDEIEKTKKELKDMDLIVACESVRESIEKLKLKDKEFYFFSDLISDESLQEIEEFISNNNSNMVKQN